MNNLISLHQSQDGEVKISIFRGSKRYTQWLTPEEATTLAHQLMSFAAGQRSEPFYLLRKDR